MKQYYKILHEDMKHFDMQYHLGLNEDVNPFNPEPECGGGLFFADKEHVLEYLSYNVGTKLAVIEVPEGEQIVNLGNIYKAHRIIIKEIQELWIKDNYEWLKETCDDTKIFINACRCNHLNFAKWIQKKGTVDIHTNNECVFRCACGNGYLNVAKWLYNLGGVNIHAFNEEAFRSACKNGHLDITKWLYNLGGVNIHVYDNYAFLLACSNGHLKTAKWLYDLGDIDIQSYRNELFCYVPKHVLNWLKTL